MTKGESFKHKLTKPSTFRKFNKIEKGCILGMILITGFFAVTYGYYSNDVAPFLPNPSKPDPFTTIWNGQVPLGNYGKANGDQYVNGIGGPCAINTSCMVTMTSPTAGQFIMVVIQDFALCNSGAITVSDTQTNVYVNTIQSVYDCKSTSGSAIVGAWTEWTTKLASSSANTVTVKDTGSAMTFDVFQFSGTNNPNLSIAATFLNGANGASGSNGVTLTNVPAFSIVLDLYTQMSSNPVTLSFASAGGTSTQIDSETTAGVGSSQINAVQRGNTNGTVTVTPSWTSGFSTAGIAHVVLQLNSFPLCPVQYTCGTNGLAYYTPANAGMVLLSPNATFPSVAISTSAVTLANGASKAIAFAIDWIAATQSLTTGQTFMWFLRTNSTLPAQANYNPLNDTSVVMIVQEYMTSSNQANIYLYIQRQVGSTLWQGSSNPGTNCSFASSLFICYGPVGVPTGPTGNSNVADPVLNFTGAANNLGGNNNQAGQSYICAGSINFGTHTCQIGGFGGSTISFQAQVQNQTLFPWLDVQSQYYFGAFDSINAPQIAFQVGQSSFDQIFSVYTPPASTLSPNQDTGGFFGWLGNSITGVFNQVGGFLSPVGNLFLGFGNSLLSVLISGFSQAISLLLIEWRLTLNFFGGIFGMGNLGDILVNTLVAIGALIVNGFSAIVSFFTGLGSIINSGYFTFLANAAILIATLLPLAILLWNIIFNAAFTVNDLLFIDYSIGMIMVAYATRKGRGALKAFFAWIALNKFLFTIVFNAAWIIFDIVTRPIHRTKETVDPVG